MKSALLLVIFVACSLSGSGQGLAELNQQLRVADGDSAKVHAYQQLAYHYQFSHMDSALHFAQAGLSYAVENRYPQGEALMTKTLGQILERHGMLDQARNHYLEARRVYAELENQQGVAWATNGLGVIAGRTGKYDEATRYFVEALALYESIDHHQGIVQTNIKLGVVNDYLGNLDKALEYYLKAEELNEDTPSSDATLTLLNNIGVIYGRRNDLQTALKYFQRGVRTCDPAKNTGIHIALLGSLGIAHEKLGNADSAWHFQQQALSLARQYDLPEEEARSLVNLADLVRTSDPDQSLELLGQALAIAQRIHHLVLITEVYESMIAQYKQRNQYELALALTEKRQLLKDSIFSVEKSREIANLQATQELARQENEIKNLALQNEKSVVQRNIMFGIVVISLIVIIIVWFYNNRVSNLNTQLIRKQNELRASNDIKDKLFSVLGHDLRAPLNRVIGLLGMLALKHEDEAESDIIKKLKQQSLGTLETLDSLLIWGHNQLKGIRLDQQVLQAKDHIGKSIKLSDDYAAQKKVRLVDNVSPEIYVQADPSHFDFVMRNLLSNAIKFSHSGGTVAIDAIRRSDQVIFSINDSGIGIPEEIQDTIFAAENESAQGTWNEKGTGIGLMLCHQYINENGGKVWVESKEGEGSTFFFSLKYKQPVNLDSDAQRKSRDAVRSGQHAMSGTTTLSGSTPA